VRLHNGSPLVGHAVALLLVLLAGSFRLLLAERIHFGFPFIFFYPVIALAAFLGGVAPGLAAIVESLAFFVLFLPFPLTSANWIPVTVVGPLLVAASAHAGYVRKRNRAIARELFEFKFIGDHASDWILLLGESGFIRYVNHKASKDLGWADSELVGRHIESLVPADQRPALRAALEKSKAGTGTPVEIVFERRDGSLAPVELACTTVRTDGEPVTYAAARDISERKQMEKKLQEMRHWESLGALAGGLAHDFNNLLTSILGNASLAKDVLPRGRDVAPMLDAVISAAESSSDLVRMMLAAAGYRPPCSEPLQLDQLLDWTLEHQPLPSNVRIAREVTKEAEHKRFEGDRRSFETLLSSLISNAAEAYGEDHGEIRVAIRSGAPPAPCTADFAEGDPGPGECLGIVVEDRGSGMSPEILARAFDPFFSTRFMGRGLGLPAVRGIVRAYSGKLCLKTAEGEGTRVEVWLPASAD
jgi:PAS domain S-box-containing protein